jgi:hypothetical protein
MVGELMNKNLKTACCYNCKFLDENDHIKGISIPKYKCSLQNSYKYHYARCEEHQEKTKGTVLK